jgi:orotate phosphoribosyltransferase
MKRETARELAPIISSEKPLDTAYRLKAFYRSVQDKATGEWLGPVVGYASGRVGRVFFNYAVLEIFPHINKRFANLIVEELDREGILGLIDVVCALPMGGMKLSEAVGTVSDSRTVFLEKEVLEMKNDTAREKSRLVALRHDIEPGLRYILGEDVANRRTSMLEAGNLIEAGGGKVVGAFCFLDRAMDQSSSFTLAGGTVVPIVPLIRRPFDDFSPEDPMMVEEAAQNSFIPKPKENWRPLAAFMEKHPLLEEERK